ncbi:MAG TPA: hypothetical protein VGF55_08120 [Gemmataceae bacterium]|jgi:hypothetical protein
MLLRCKCPGCGDQKEYVAEEVGSTADCFRCGQRFTLQGNPGRAAWQIIAATLAVFVLIGGAGARIYLRAKRAEARHHAAQVAHERHFQDDRDDGDDGDD